MEVVVQETGEAATKKQRSHPESQHTEPDVSKKVGTSETTLTEHLQQLRTRFKRDTGSGVASEKSQATHPQTCTSVCVGPSCQEIQSQRLHPVASLEAIASKWQNIQIDQAQWSHLTQSLKHRFCVLIDEGCHLKVAKILFSMKDTDLHRNLAWTNHMISTWNTGFVVRSACRQRRILDVRSSSNFLRQGKYLKGTSDCDCTGTSSHRSTRIPRQSSGRIQRQRRCPGEMLSPLQHASGKNTRSGRLILHTRIRVTSYSTS